jgi:hypothetical protein
MVHAFEGNRAETTTMVPVLRVGVLAAELPAGLVGDPGMQDVLLPYDRVPNSPGPPASRGPGPALRKAVGAH